MTSLYGGFVNMVWLTAFPLIYLNEADASAIAVMLVGLLFMNLDRAPTLDRLAVVAGFLFIAVMFTITVCDPFHRI